MRFITSDDNFTRMKIIDRHIKVVFHIRIIIITILNALNDTSFILIIDSFNSNTFNSIPINGNIGNIIPMKEFINNDKDKSLIIMIHVENDIIIDIIRIASQLLMNECCNIGIGITLIGIKSNLNFFCFSHCFIFLSFYTFLGIIQS